ETAAADDLRHLGLRRRSPAAARRDQALRRRRRRRHSRLPPAPLTRNRGQHSADRAAAAASTALGHRAACAGPPVDGVAYLRAARRVLHHLDGLHHQQRDLPGNAGHYAATYRGLTPETAATGAARGIG